MNLRYIELDDITHLSQQAQQSQQALNSGNSEYSSKLWRESYYFNMTDPISGLSFISTIGILPNKRLTTGFFLIIKNNRVLKLKPLISRKTPVFYDYSFKLKDLEYIIEGPFWILKYNSKNVKFEIKFEPMNKIFSYIKTKSDMILKNIGSQHYEQFGIYKGEFVFRNDRVEIGPCFGHRDHSWGIRDWSSLNKYRLFCCAFSKSFAFNLWEGWIGNKKFLKGYIFDGIKNIELKKSHVLTSYKKNGKQPGEAKISILDEHGRKYFVTSQVKFSISVPPRQSIMYETLSEMYYGKNKGYGLTEYLFHEPRLSTRFWTLLKLLTYL